MLGGSGGRIHAPTARRRDRLPMTLRRISLAVAAVAVAGLLAAGSVAAAGIDLVPAVENFVAQATPTASPAAPGPAQSGGAGLVGQDGSGTPLLLGAALVLGAAVLAGTGRWVMARRD